MQELTLTTKEYGFLGPLEREQVSIDGVRLQIDHYDPMSRTVKDPAVQGGEISFSEYIIGRAAGNRDFVGIPVFPYRALRYRCFFTLKDSGIQLLSDLEGKRLGINAWPTTSSTWNRAVLRENGIRLENSDWYVGPLDDLRVGPAPAKLPPYVKPTEPGWTVEQLLLEGKIDAIVCPRPPASFYQPDSPMVRIVPNYREVEREHFFRTRLYPPDHMFVLRRDVFQADPGVVVKLFDAFEQSKALWQTYIRTVPYSNMTPWALADIEEVIKVMGADWMPNGVARNLEMIQILCDECLAQGLIDSPLPAESVFDEFEQAAVRKRNAIP